MPIAESDAVADAGSASNEPGHNCRFCPPWQAPDSTECSRRRADSSPSELHGTHLGRMRGTARSEGATILFQVCSKGKQRTVCAVGAQDREPEWATIECSKGERKLWQAAEPGNAKQ